MVTLADIARDTGLSLTTVSQILNGHGGYRAATQQRVQAAAERLGYRPHSLARALASGRSRTLGLMTPEFSLRVATHGMLLGRLTFLARRLGYLVYVTTYDEVAQIPALAQDLAHHRVAGVILHQIVPVLGDAGAVFEQHGIPYLYLDHVPEVAGGVAMNRRHGFDEAAAHLAELGHRRALFLVGELEAVHAERRITPYRQACAERGIALELMPFPGVDRNDGAMAWARQWPAEPGMPTALLCGDDEMALAVISGLHAAGRRVPEEVSVIGFNDLPMSRVMWPALTTIHQPREPMAEKVIEQLICRLQEPAAVIAREQMDCHLVIRASTGPARSA